MYQSLLCQIKIMKKKIRLKFLEKKTLIKVPPSPQNYFTQNPPTPNPPNTWKNAKQK